MPAQPRPATRITALGVTGLLAVGLLGVIAAPAYATTYFVDSPGDLVTAINDANVNPGSDTIVITGGFTLAADLPLIYDDLLIEGGGHTIGGGGFTGFRAESPDPATPISFEISSLTLTNAGMVVGIWAAIQVLDVRVKLDGVTVTGSAGDGFSAEGSTVTVTNSVFSENARKGAGISITDQTVTITDGTFDDNGFEGLQLYADGAGTIAVTDSWARENTHEGMTLWPMGTAVVTITGGGASGNTRSGFYTPEALEDDTVLRMTGFEANDNRANGVEIYAEDNAQAILRDVLATLNDDDGFEFGGAGFAEITLTDLIAESNGDDGFDLDLWEDSTLIATGLEGLSNSTSGIVIGLNDDASAQISDSVFDDNGQQGVFAEVDGGGFFLQRVDATRNARGGYAILLLDEAEMTIADSIIDENGDGGVMGQLNASTLTITGSTMSRNEVGVAFYVEDGSEVVLRNSTVSGNRPGADWSLEVAGIFFEGSGDMSTVLIANSTVANNLSASDAPGVGVIGITLQIENSILANNGDWDLATDGDSTILVVEHSLVENSDGHSTVDLALATGTGNITGVDPLLGPLADNGGRTLTHLPLAGSPVIDAGDPAFVLDSLPLDQRGEVRVQNSRLDIGAVEGEAVLPPTGMDPTLSIILLGGGLLLLLAGGALVVLRRRRENTEH